MLMGKVYHKIKYYITLYTGCKKPIHNRGKTEHFFARIIRLCYTNSEVKILVTNDDGVHSDGLWALAEAFQAWEKWWLLPRTGNKAPSALP